MAKRKTKKEIEAALIEEEVSTTVEETKTEEVTKEMLMEESKLLTEPEAELIEDAAPVVEAEAELIEDAAPVVEAEAELIEEVKVKRKLAEPVRSKEVKVKRKLTEKEKPFVRKNNAVIHSGFTV